MSAAADLVMLIEPIARLLLGEPNARLSKRYELRFGSRGSLSVDLRKGTFYDNELDKGGGVLDLIERETGRKGAERFIWLEEQGFLGRRDEPPARGNGAERPKAERRARRDNGPALGPIVEAYDYRDENDQLLFQVTRFEPKDFRQRRPDASARGGWRWKLEGVRNVPYRTPELLEALSLGRVVFIVEGERDVDRLWSLGVPATTNAGGAGKWKAELTTFFAGADVVIIPDHDPQKLHPKTKDPMFHPDGRPVLPGQDHAAAVAAALAGVAARVRVLDLVAFWPEMPLKGDVSDWLDQGGTAEALYALAERVPDWSPEPEPEAPPEPQAQRQGGAAWTNEASAFGYTWRWHVYGESDPLDERDWLVECLLPKTGTALISGQWGTYKTFVADDLAASVMTGTPFIGFPVRRQGGVVFIACEGQKEVAIRITAAFEARGGQGKAPFVWVDASPRLLDPSAAPILTAMVRHAAELMRERFGLDVALVIADTAGKAAGLTREGQLNDDAIAKIVMKVLADAALATVTLVVGVAHFGKNVETGTKGSSGFEDDADAVLACLGSRGINGIVESPRLCARKRRGGPNGEEFAFTTKAVDLGNDKNGKPVTTLVIEWQTEPQAASPKAKPDRWAKSLRLLRQVMMGLIADCGSEQRPFADGPIVRAVDLEVVRKSFYKRYPAMGDADAKTGTRRKAFDRAISRAMQDGLIAVSDIGMTTYVWLVTPATGGEP